MFKIMIRVLEVFTIEYIPRLPISLRKPFYKLILPLRKLYVEYKVNVKETRPIPIYFNSMKN